MGPGGPHGWLGRLVLLQHRVARRAATVSFIDKALRHRWNTTEHNESGCYDRYGHQLVGH